MLRRRCTYHLVSQLFLVAQLLHLMRLNLICPLFSPLFFLFVILPCNAFPNITLSFFKIHYLRFCFWSMQQHWPGSTRIVCERACVHVCVSVFGWWSNCWLIRGQRGSDILQEACHAFKSREKEPNAFNLKHLQGGQSTQSAPLLLLA